MSKELVYKRGKIWYMDFRVNGKRIHRSTGKKSKRDAMEVAQAERKKLDGSFWGDSGSGMTLSQAVDKVYFESWMFQDSGEQSKSRMDYLVEFLGDPPLETIDERHLDRIKDHFRSEGYKPATINRYLAHLKKVLRTAWLRWHVLKSMPYFEMYREDNGRIRVITKDEERWLDRFSRDLCYEHFADLWTFLIDTGLRTGESHKMTYQEHVDFEARTVNLTGDITKNKKPRHVPLTDRAYEILMKYRGNDCGKPFPFTSDRIAKVFTKMRKEMDIKDPDFVTHALRHTAASRLIALGVDIYTVKNILGHSSIKVTERYAHMNLSELRGAIDKLNGF